MSTEPKITASPSGLFIAEKAGVGVVQVVRWIAENDRRFRRTQARINRYGSKF